MPCATSVSLAYSLSLIYVLCQPEHDMNIYPSPLNFRETSKCVENGHILRVDDVSVTPRQICSPENSGSDSTTNHRDMVWNTNFRFNDITQYSKRENFSADVKCIRKKNGKNIMLAEALTDDQELQSVNSSQPPGNDENSKSLVEDYVIRYMNAEETLTSEDTELQTTLSELKSTVTQTRNIPEKRQKDIKIEQDESEMIVTITNPTRNSTINSKVFLGENIILTEIERDRNMRVESDTKFGLTFRAVGLELGTRIPTNFYVRRSLTAAGLFSRTINHRTNGRDTHINTAEFVFDGAALEDFV